MRALGHFGSAQSQFGDYWSAGLRLAVAGGTPPQTGGLVTFLENISVPFATFHASPGVYAGTSTYLDELTVAHIGLDGKYASEFTETVRRPYSSPILGNTTGAHPWNTSHVISLRTAKKRGLASNGRWYYPGLGLPVVPTTGRLAAATVTTRLAAAKVLFDAINTHAQTASSGLRIYVLSAGAKNPNTGVKGVGWSAVCTEIRADQRLDSIEKRENDQPAVWQTASIA